MKKRIGFFDFLYFIKVRTRLTLFFLLISVIPIIIVGFFSYNNSRKTIEEKVGLYSSELAHQVTRNINTKLSQLKIITEGFYSDNEIMRILGKEDYEKAYQKILDERKLKEYLRSIKLANDDIEGLIIYRPDNNSIISAGTINGQDGTVEYYLGENFDKSRYYKEVISNNGNSMWYTGINNNQFVYLLRKLVNINTGGETGVLIFIINESAFNKLTQTSHINNFFAP